MILDEHILVDKKNSSNNLTLYGRMLPKGNIAAVFYLKPPYNRIESILLYHHKLKYLSLECFIFD